MKAEKSSSDLEAEVIFRDICAHCGTCGTCPHIQYYEDGPKAGLPYVTDACNETVGLCYNSCPRTSFNVEELELKKYGKTREDAVMGFYLDKITVSSSGSIPSALLKAAFAEGMIDAVIVPEKKSKKPVNNMPKIVESEVDIPELDTLNLSYTGPLVKGIRDAYLKGKKSVALVGNPCHHQGITKLYYSDFHSSMKSVGLQIAIMCASGGATGCSYCLDYAGEFADISIGTIGVKKGSAVLLIRTEIGKKVVDAAVEKGLIKIESKDAALDKLVDIAVKKKKRNALNLIKLNAAKIGYMEFSDKELASIFG